MEENKVFSNFSPVIYNPNEEEILRLKIKIAQLELELYRAKQKLADLTPIPGEWITVTTSSNNLFIDG